MGMLVTLGMGWVRKKHYVRNGYVVGSHAAVREDDEPVTRGNGRSSLLTHAL